MAVTLIGYRGSGKSAVGAALAALWRWDFVDADVEIERRAGKTIREIFADSGEPEFRRFEREVMADLLQRDQCVIAAGGGAVMNPDTQTDLTQSGPVIWLQADVDTLLARMAGDATTTARRPNLTASGGREEVESLLAVRTPIYRQCATVVIETDDLNIDEIVRRIDAELPAESRGGSRP